MRGIIKSTALIISICITLAFSIKTYAQIPPATQTSGGVERMEQEIEKQKQMLQQFQPKKKPVIEEKATKEAPPLPEGQKVLIKQIIVEGSTLLPEAKIKAVTSQYEGKDLSLADMQKVADLLTDAYRVAGYATSRAYLPPQTIKDGILHIKVIEGKVGKVEIKGNRYFKTSLLRKKLKINPDEYFDYAQLQKSLASINENTDRNAKAILAPGKEPGTTDILLEVKDRIPLHVGFSYDNFGPRTIEKNRYAATFEDNNLLGFDDKLFVRFHMSEASLYKFKNIRYLFPINDKLDFGYYFINSRIKLGKEFKPVESIGHAKVMGIYLNQAILANNIVDLRANVGFDYKKMQNYLLNLRVSRDEVRVAKVGLDLDVTDKLGRSIFVAEMDNGIPDIMGGMMAKDPQSSRPIGGGGKFLKWMLNLYRLQPLPLSTNLLVKINGQTSRDTLVASEQFQIGGAASVRGYPPGEVAGDKGCYASAEWSVPVYFIPKKLKVPFTQDKLYDTLRLVAFYDWATTSLSSTVPGQKEKDTLKGYGWGVRFNLRENLSMRLEIGYPQGRLPSDGNRAHPWGEVTYRF